jgi:hypothetical protein
MMVALDPGPLYKALSSSRAPHPRFLPSLVPPSFFLFSPYFS